MGLTETIIKFCSDVITSLGYLGIFLLMVCESMYVPIPSFAVMPFVGFVAYQVAMGQIASGPTFWTGTLVGAFGGIVGSLLTYGFGYWAGPKGVRRFGPYVNLNEADLDRTQAWFERRGAVTVFTGRFIPVVRHFISTVAGIAHMHLVPFLAMTFLGAFLWDLFLAWCGWKLQENYVVIKTYMKPIDIAVIVVFGLGFLHLCRKLHARVRGGKSGKEDPPAP